MKRFIESVRKVSDSIIFILKRSLQRRVVKINSFLFMNYISMHFYNNFSFLYTAFLFIRKHILEEVYLEPLLSNHFFGHSIETQPMSSLAVTFTTQEINSWIPSQCHYYCSDRSFTIAATLSIPVASFHTRTIALQDSCGISYQCRAVPKIPNDSVETGGFDQWFPLPCPLISNYG